ncbi:hypothetical protein TNCV_1777651 [Trichonephila clavipes]|nr:hypothetical protein TNCV_1777651 [Trichonephila clavipes]
MRAILKAKGLIEVRYRQLKAAIMCHANEKLTEILQTILIGFQVEFKNTWAAHQTNGYEEKRAPVEFKERHLDEWPSINCPVELAERLEFEDVRSTLKQKTHTLTPVRRPEVRESNQGEHFRKFDNHNTRRTGNFSNLKDI